MPESLHISFYIILPLIAFFYASVGHGGASGYLALMALYSFSPDTMKPIALILNIVVAFISFSFFYHSNKIQTKLFLYLIISSIPMAYYGATLNIESDIYKTILGILLLIPALRLIYKSKNLEFQTRDFNPILALVIGASIGLLSGIIGIGGGILLSPILIYLRWSSIKETASISALFIVLNSISGILGTNTSFDFYNYPLLIIILLAFFGGALGSYLGSHKYNTPKLRIALSLVLFMAAIKLIFA